MPIALVLNEVDGCRRHDGDRTTYGADPGGVSRPLGQAPARFPRESHPPPGRTRGLARSRGKERILDSLPGTGVRASRRAVLYPAIIAGRAWCGAEVSSRSE